MFNFCDELKTLKICSCWKVLFGATLTRLSIIFEVVLFELKVFF